MGKDVVNIGLLGCGTVGSGVVKILSRNQEEFSRRLQVPLRVKKVLVRDPEKKRPEELAGIPVVTGIEDIVSDPGIHIVVEVMGGVDETRGYLLQALGQGKHVVTANKDLLALHGPELFRVAAENRVNLYYEASVAGGIPLIRPLKHCLAANRIKKVMGIINGTTNYIITRMTLNEMSYGDALREAQEKGFAEQDPSSDVLGKDAAYKLVLMASLAFNSLVKVESVYTQGIDRVTLRDIRYAEELGYKLKLLAIGEQGEGGLVLRVHPTLIPASHPLAAVNYEFNGVFLEGDAVGEIMLYGRGAGEMPTGSAVVADILEAARHLQQGLGPHIMEVNYREKPVVSLDRVESKFYLRLKAVDQSGVFASLANIFGDEKVSLDMIIQKRRVNDTAEVVLVTHLIQEEKFFRALERLKQLPSIQEISQVIRVQETV